MPGSHWYQEPVPHHTFRHTAEPVRHSARRGAVWLFVATALLTTSGAAVLIGVLR